MSVHVWVCADWVGCTSKVGRAMRAELVLAVEDSWVGLGLGGAKVELMSRHR